MIFDHALFLPFCVLFYRVVLDDIRPCIISAILCVILQSSSR